MTKTLRQQATLDISLSEPFFRPYIASPSYMDALPPDARERVESATPVTPPWWDAIPPLPSHGNWNPLPSLGRDARARGPGKAVRLATPAGFPLTALYDTPTDDIARTLNFIGLCYLLYGGPPMASGSPRRPNVPTAFATHIAQSDFSRLKKRVGERLTQIAEDRPLYWPLVEHALPPVESASRKPSYRSLARGREATNIMRDKYLRTHVWSWRNFALVIDGHYGRTNLRIGLDLDDINPDERIDAGSNTRDTRDTIWTDDCDREALAMRPEPRWPMTRVTLPDPTYSERTVIHSRVASTLHLYGLLVTNQRWLDAGGRERLAARGLPTDHDLRKGRLVASSPFVRDPALVGVNDLDLDDLTPSLAPEVAPRVASSAANATWPDPSLTNIVDTFRDVNARTTEAYRDLMGGHICVWDDPLALGDF